MTTGLYPAEVLAEMREWLADLTFGDVDPDDFLDPDQFTDEEILTGVEQHYDGGVRAFVQVWRVAR